MYYTVSKWIKLRLGLILLVFFLVAMGILARAYQLQVIEAKSLREAAAAQYRHIQRIIPSRGMICDRQGNVLVVSQKAFSVYARPDQVKDPGMSARRLARLSEGSGGLEISQTEIQDKLSKDQNFVWLARQVPESVGEKLKVLDLPGVGLIEESRRFYPGGTLAASLLGFAGVDAQGLEGIEYAYDGMIRGQPRYILVEQDARGEAIRIFPDSGGQGESEGSGGGADLVLTLDKAIQYLAEREVRMALRNYRAKRAGAIVMEPQTGRILAMAMEPGFDPNHFQDWAPEFWRNWLVADMFEPGSTFKVFMAAAVLQEGIAGRYDRFFCENGAYDIAGETINDTRRHGWLSLQEIVTYSSNIGAAKLGEKLGRDRMYEYIERFGFGQRTGLDFPGEARGLVREPGTWSRIAVDTIAFGQGVSVTALQMVTALSAIANRGELMRPYLVERAVRPDGTKIVLHRPERINRVISPEVAQELTSILCGVVSPEGTGSKAAISGYPVAGKTGTAQKPKPDARGYERGKYICSFMGFAPAHDPRVAVIVIIDEPRTNYAYGGTLAAPVFREIVRQALIHLNVPPANAETSGISRIEKRTDKKNDKGIFTARNFQQDLTEKDIAILQENSPAQGKMPALLGQTMREALLLLQDRGLEIQFSGTGVAVEQAPLPGDPLKGVKACRVRFSPRH